MQISWYPKTQSDRGLVAEFLAILVLFVGLLVRVLIRRARNPIEWGLHPYLVEFVQSGGNHNYLGQRSAHLAIVLLTFSFVLLARLYPGLSYTPLRKIAKKFSVVSAILVTAFSFLSVVYDARQGLSFLLLSVIVGVIFFFYLRTGNFRKLDLYIMLSLVGLIFAATLPGLFRPLDLSTLSQSAIAEIQSNYSLVVTQGDRLAAGYRLFLDVKSFYGFLLPVLTAIWQRNFGAMTWGNYVTVIKLMQFFYLLAVVWLFRRHSKKNSAALIVAVLMVLPWYHTMQESLLFPNLSPWRLLSFPLSLLVIQACRSKPAASTAFLLGASLALFMFINVESSVAIASGYLMYCVFRFGNIGVVPYARCTFFGLLGVAISLLIFTLLVKSGLGYFPDFISFFRSRLELSTLVQTGWWGGFPLVFVPFALLCFIHQLYALFKIAGSGRGASNFSNSFRASAISMGLVWFAYYVNRPSPWYLHGQYFLYGFGIIDLVRTLCLKQRLKHHRNLGNFEKPLVLFACLFLVLIPCMGQSFETALPSYLKAFQKLPQDVELVSGVVLPAVVAKEVRKKSDFIRKISGGHGVVYLTSETFLVPKLSGIPSDIPFDDSYVELPYVKDTNDFVASLRANGVSKILLDDVDHCVLVGDKDRVKWQQDMFMRLTKVFDKTERRQGWIILEKVDRAGSNRSPESENR